MNQLPSIPYNERRVFSNRTITRPHTQKNKTRKNKEDRRETGNRFARGRCRKNKKNESGLCFKGLFRMRNRKKATAKKQNKTTKQHDMSFCLGSPSISFSQVNTMKSPGNRNQTENKNKKKKAKLHPQRLRGTAFARKQNPD